MHINFTFFGLSDKLRTLPLSLSLTDVFFFIKSLSHKLFYLSKKLFLFTLLAGRYFKIGEM
jgi:hypothetical protein